MSAGPDHGGEIELEELQRRLDEVVVVDVRHAGEYEGKLGYPCDPRQGHIPGARHLDLDELLMMGEEEVRAWLSLSDGAEIVLYCHSGSRSRFAAQVLCGFGYEARNYVGSWHEWSQTELPIET
ncbi:MAG TPA: rhodanese-like domain-containing protein [Gaiellaceae bacterium]